MWRTRSFEISSTTWTHYGNHQINTINEKIYPTFLQWKCRNRRNHDCQHAPFGLTPWCVPLSHLPSCNTWVINSIYFWKSVILHLPKTKITMEKQQLEDVSPIKKWLFPSKHVSSHVAHVSLLQGMSVPYPHVHLLPSPCVHGWQPNEVLLDDCLVKKRIQTAKVKEKVLGNNNNLLKGVTSKPYFDQNHILSLIEELDLFEHEFFESNQFLWKQMLLNPKPA